MIKKKEKYLLSPKVLLVTLAMVALTGLGYIWFRNGTFINNANLPNQENVILEPGADIYLDDKYGFKINYPSGWNVATYDFSDKGGDALFDYSGKLVTTFEYWVSFDVSEFAEDPSVWGVNIYKRSINTLEAVQKESGAQFKDRMQDTERININGLDAIKVTTTAPSIESWKSVSVIVVDNEYIYKISNGAISDKEFQENYKIRTGREVNWKFEDFYSSFELIK
ncbi:hypothetical protein A2415_00230 [candidate division WWE3 bacterium RIFOXYC1_FULL_39_7]|uniref:Uncharacterized protein n=1 Tax=candidate division WWE3 bacterium RIFOXYC1_FULL_39_7 TaxID=1802643 RepID=A0A1F4WJM4_UNCKA|nr:MAG: hypothetical protein A2415_00230 [candidate division WWE3 bacterium RIFOXYC1_FULL_39_7]